MTETANSCNIQEVLTNLGYNLKDFGKEFRTRPIYRDSSNDTSLAIDKITGQWIDYSAGISGNLEELIKLSLNLSTEADVEAWLKSKEFNFTPLLFKKPLVRLPKHYPLELLNKLKKDHGYWIKRGISEQTVKTFEGGVADSGRMKGRYVFPIFNSKRQLVGFAGRDLYKDYATRPKWKLIGSKSDWKYPLIYNAKVMRELSEVVLVESIGDMLSLWESGIKNCMVLFGVQLYSARLCTLLKFNPKHIIVATNNDYDKSINVGEGAANKIKDLLLKHFDPSQVIVKLPTKKDFGEMSKEEILSWKESVKASYV